MQLKNALLLVLVLVPFLLLLFSWLTWTRHDKQIVTGHRTVLFIVGAAATALSLLFYVGFALTSSAHTLAWLRLGFWTGVAGLVLCSFGKGRSRGLGLTSAGVVLVVWSLFAWTPA